MSLWILESGTARLLNLFGKTPRLQITFNPQAVCDRQSVGGRRVGYGFTAPQRGAPEFLKGSTVKDHKIWFISHHRCRFCFQDMASSRRMYRRTDPNGLPLPPALAAHGAAPPICDN